MKEELTKEASYDNNEAERRKRLKWSVLAVSHLVRRSNPPQVLRTSRKEVSVIAGQKMVAQDP